MHDNLHTSTEARDRLMAGIRKVADAVGGTMGTGGSNALIEAMENPGHLATNDGATIIGAIRLSDPIEEMGRKILLEAVSRANKQSGDGSSTTTILTAAILEEGIKQLGKHSMMDIKRSLEACVPFIEAAIEQQKRDITVDEVGAVAAISAEDPEIGDLIQEIYQKIGKGGIIHWDISKTTEDSYTVGSGITIDGAGYLSPYMCDIDEKTGLFTNIARWKQPRVLLVRQKIASAADFDSLFSSLFAKEIKEVVVFCDDIEPTVIPDLIQTRAMRGFKTLVVKMPVLWRDQWYEDLSLATGATIVDPAAGLSLKTVTIEHLGRVENIVVSKDETFIDGIADLSGHIADLKKENTDDSLYRAARLNTQTARLFIGAHSESALSYKRLKVEDAISAAWQALNGGIVAGGGVALLDIDIDPYESVGALILSQALQAPAEQIAKNIGVKFDLTKYGDGFGLDTSSAKIVDMFEANITDPANVVLNAARNAISVAASILTTTTVVTLPKHDETLR